MTMMTIMSMLEYFQNNVNGYLCIERVMWVSSPHRQGYVGIIPLNTRMKGFTRTRWDMGMGLL